MLCVAWLTATAYVSPTTGNPPRLAGSLTAPNRDRARPGRGAGSCEHRPPAPRLTRIEAVATWEDGPEYAPHERPQYFADAPVAPLEQAPPVARPADGQPASRPRFEQPSAPVAELATLVPEPPDERDPHRPFDTLTTTLTSDSAWGSPAGGPGAGPQPFVPTVPFTTSGPALAVGPAAASPQAGPVTQAEAPAYPPLAPGQAAPGGPPSVPSPYTPYPVPGTPEWFAPPPTTYGDQQQPGRVDAKQVVEAATPGLCITLAVGGLILPLAPVLLVVAVLLSTRVRVAQRGLRVTFRIAAAAVGFFAVVGLFRSVVDGDPWWSFVSGWSAAICWALLAVTLLTVYQALRRPPQQQPPTPNPWG